MDLFKKRVFIIAEAGVNHNGNLEMAFDLVDKALESGANAVKFQTYITDKCISRTAPLAEYQKVSNSLESQFDLLKRLELPLEMFRKIKQYCDNKGILFLSTPDEEESLRFLCTLNLKGIKVGSGEITNHPFLAKIARTKKPILLSTGASTLEEVRRAIRIFYQNKNHRIALLHCVSEYPSPIEDVNLMAMVTLAQTFKIPVGFSDHTLGIIVPLAAVALGAQVIEKHLTLDKNLPGPDHSCSLEPYEFKTMVDSIRLVEKALGNGVKRPAPSERKNLEVIRKSLFTAQKLDSGNRLMERDLLAKRPGNGIPPYEIKKVLGLRLRRTLREDEQLTWKDLQSKSKKNRMHK